MREYIEKLSKVRGDCDYCDSRDTSILDVGQLCDAFQNMVSRFRREEKSITDSLLELVQGKYMVFSDELYGEDGNGAADLLEAIVNFDWDDDDGEPPISAADSYSTRSSEFHSTQSEQWQEFTDAIRQGNHAASPITEIFGEDLGRAEVALPAGSCLWRVRVGFNVDSGAHRDPLRVPYRHGEIGPPPPEKTEDMRASKKGEVVFYGADDEATALAERRPATGYVVSVGRFVTGRPLQVVDLTRVLEPPLNPFTEESLAWFEEFYELLDVFDEQLAKPLERDDDKRDYKPCQEAAAAIRAAGYDGIRYRSAMRTGGTNVVIFDPAAMVYEDSRLVRVVAVAVNYDEYDGT